eukprot:2706939-Pleurochrysis_carterae.AAC.5
MVYRQAKGTEARTLQYAACSESWKRVRCKIAVLVVWCKPSEKDQSASPPHSLCISKTPRIASRLIYWADHHPVPELCQVRIHKYRRRPNIDNEDMISPAESTGTHCHAGKHSEHSTDTNGLAKRSRVF